MSAPSLRDLTTRLDLDPAAVRVALADVVPHTQPWYVVALAGLGTWVGASFLAAAVLAAGVLSPAPARVVAGLVVLAAATVASRHGHGVVATQSALIGTVVGQALVLSVVASSTAAVVAMLLQLVVLVAIARPTARTLAALSFFGSLASLLKRHDVPLDVVPLVAAVVAVVCFCGERLALGTRVGSLVRPVGYAATIALIAAFVADELGRAVDGMRLLSLLPAPTTFVAAALVCALGMHARTRLLVGLGLTASFVVLVVRAWDAGVAVGAQAAWMAGVGGLLLALRAATSPRRTGPKRRASWAVLAATTLALGAPLALVTAKERLLATGTTLLLALAPPDALSPASTSTLELRLQVEVEAAAALLEPSTANDVASRGSLVVAVGEGGVATFVRLDDGTQLAAHERRLRYRVEGPRSARRVRIGPHEVVLAGDATHARYGELVVADDGAAVLVGLREVDGARIGG